MRAVVTVLSMVLLLGGCQREQNAEPTWVMPAPPAQDYLTPAVRQQVEELKAEVGTAPADLTDLEHRLDVLWAWANAMARRDGGLKFAPNLTALIGQAKGQFSGYNLLTNPNGEFDAGLAAKAFGNGEATREVVEQLDGHVRELALRESDPEAFGHLGTDTPGPFVAASYQTIRQVWTVGSRNLEPGGYLMVAQHFMADQGVYQVEDPKADHYVSIEASRPGVRFEPIRVVMQGHHGGFRQAAENLCFAVREGTLTRGDRVTITYGDRRGGSRGFRVQSVSNSFYQLPIYVSFDGSSFAALLDMTPFEVVGQTTAGVQGFAPSVVAVNEPFDLSIRSEDPMFNRATGPIPAYRVSLNGQDYAELPAGLEPIQWLKAVRLKEPGIYRFGFESLDGRVRGTSNPVWVQKKPSNRIYWGDTHGHSGFAEGQGSPEAFFSFGRDESRLDFLTLSEHDVWLDDGEWQRMIDTVRHFNDEGRFIAYLGYEYTVGHARGGHHNVLFRTPDNRERINVQRFPVLSKLYAGLNERYEPADVLIIPHAHQAGYWRLNDAGMENLVEIHSQHGYFEWFGQRYLGEGFRLGFIAASDDHLGHPGYTSVRPTGYVYQGGLAAVRAQEKTSSALFAAMKQRQTYATTVDRMILEFSVNKVDMGGIAEIKAKNRIRGQVMGTAPIDTITILKNGSPVWQQDYRASRAIDSSSALVELTFHSESHSKGFEIDNPRGARLWYGTARVQGAEVVGLDPGYRNALLPPTRADGKDKVRFALQTRGESRRLRLVLRGANPNTRIAIHLEAKRESPTAPAATRKPAQIDAQDFGFSLAEVAAGRAEQPLPVDEYKDWVRLRVLDPNPVLDQAFEYDDPSPSRPGDYYYVRVEQSNSGIAWSSPVWLRIGKG